MKRIVDTRPSNRATRHAEFVDRLLRLSTLHRRVSIRGTMRRALSVSLVIVLLTVQAPAAPQVIVGMTAQWHAGATLWLRSNGWAARFETLLSGAQKPSPGSQAAQSRRDARVARVHISPGDLTITEGDEVDFTARALDTQDAPLGGIRFKWRAYDVEQNKQVRMRDGRFVARRAGTFHVVAECARQQSSVTVIVQTDERRRRRGGPPDVERPVSSRDVPPNVAAQPQQKTPTRKRAAGDTSGSVKFAKTSYGSTPAAAAPAVPLIDPEAGWDGGNGGFADDPGNQVGDPPGAPADDGAGSGNFQISAPVIGLPGRNQNLGLGLSYNSHLWNKTGTSEVTFDPDRGWPAAGWALGFGKMMGLNTQGSMLIEPDGTRRSYSGNVSVYGSYTSFTGKTADGSFIDYQTSSYQGNINWAQASYPNGTRIDYGAPANGAVFPIRITDANGNYVSISYRYNRGPDIEVVSDTLGRVINFHYDTTGYGLLTAITAPEVGSGTRTLVRFQYQDSNLNNGYNYGFAAGIVTRVRTANPPQLKAIYYPGTGTGYWFGDPDSYSSYGMLAKVVEQRSMSFNGPAPIPIWQGTTGQGNISPGTPSQQRTYNYPMGPGTLTDAPTYTTATMWWANIDTGDSVTSYFVQKNAVNPSDPNTPSSKSEVTLPNNTKSVQYAYRLPGNFKDGLIYQDDTFDGAGTLISTSKVTWEKGAYEAPRPLRVDATDERGQTLKTEFSYGSVYNQTTEVRAFDYDGVTLLRRTATSYQNSGNYTFRHIFNLPLTAEVFGGDGVRVSRAEYEYDNAELAPAPGVTAHDPSHDPHNTDWFENGQCCRWEQGPYGEQYCAEYCQEPVFNPATNYRGLVTKVTSYSNAAPEPAAGAVAETRTYDITGNLVTGSASCCEQTKVNYTIDTQFAYPESQSRGSSDPNSTQRVTTSATHDFNTGLSLTATDANGRTTQTTYYQASLRPQDNISPTGARTTFQYDDAQMTVTETSTLSAGGAVAAKSVVYLNGLGLTRRVEALGVSNAWDVMETKYDTLGRAWKQSRPYRNGSEQPQWSENFYDAQGRVWKTLAPDGSANLTSYNETSRPSAAMQGNPAGQTTKTIDAWGRERWGRADSQGRLVEVVEPNPSGDGTVANGGLLTTYTYDTLGNLVQVNQGEQQRRFRYDSLGRLTSQKLAETSATLNDAGQYVGAGGQWSDAYAYDTRSNLIARTDARGVTANFAYNNDPLNRLQSMSYTVGAQYDTSSPIANAATIVYEYMSSGDKTRPWKVTTENTRQDWYVYDGEGRVSDMTMVILNRLSHQMTTSYAYDALDRVTDITYPAQYQFNVPNPPRRVVHHDYDVASRLSELKVNGASYASQFDYNAASQAKSLKVGVAGANQVTEKYVYDPTTGLISEQKVFRGADENSNKLMHLSYDYLRPGTTVGRTGQLTKITNNLNAQKGRTYTYDQLGRLKDATGGSPGSTSLWTQHYDYDRYGNRNSVTASGNQAAALNTPDDPKPPLSDVQLAWTPDTGTEFSRGDATRSVSDSVPSLLGPSRPTEVPAGKATDSQRASGTSPTYGRSAAALTPAQSPTVYSAVADFSATQNPSGAWGYGYRPAGGSYSALPNNNNIYGFPAGMHTWYLPNGGWNLPAVFHNGTGATTTYSTITQPTDELNLFPGPNGERSIVRWTAQAAGTVQVAGRFEGLDSQGASSDATITLNGAQVFAASVTGSGVGSRQPFSFTNTVAVGDTLEFSVGYGSNANVSGDSTGLAATVTLQQVPTHASAFVSQSVPATMTAGQSYGVSLTMKNTGSNTWTTAGNYRLGSQNPQDNNTWGSRISLPATTAPNQDATFAFNVTAPSTPGTYNFQWRMVQDGVTWFGAYSTNVAVVVAASTTATYSAVADFSATQNPSGAWGYGYRPAGGSYSALPNNNNIYGFPAGMHTWYLPNGGWNLPAVFHNGTGATTTYSTITQPTDELNLFPGPNGERSIVRWTAQAAGTVQVAGRFKGLDSQGATSDVVITHNGASVFSGNVNGYGAQVPFSLSRGVAAGDTIEFSVGYGANANVSGDSTGLAATITSQQSGNQPPVAHAGGPYSGSVGQNVQFNGTGSSDANGTITSYQWNFGDGTTGTGATPTHAYASAGTYTASLTVTDNQGAQGATTTTVTVAAAVSPIPRDGLASVSYAATSNRVNSNGWQYDAAGNQTRTQTASGVWQRMEYDAANRLVAVKTDAGLLIAAYTYADTNARLISYEGGARTYYAWGGGGVIAEYTEVDGTASAASPQWSKSYVYLGERLLATQQPNGSGGEYVEYHHPDRLGTRLVTNNTNGSFFEQTGLPFGTALNAESTGASNRRFTSYDRSLSTGLDYAVNRHYDSLQGRFTQVDPLGMQASSLSDPQSLNLYAYCGNDPVNNTDPSGLFWGKLWRFIKKVLKIIAVAIAVAVAVITIIYAPYLFTTTLKAVLGIIAAVANAAQSVLSALGLKTAAAVFGIISAAASFGTSLANLAGKGNMTWKNIFKAIQDGATLVSRTLSIYGHKIAAQVFDLISSAAGFITSSLKDIKDKVTGTVSRKFAPSAWEIYKFARGTAEKVANLTGATKVGGYLNVLGIVDDAYDFYRGIKDRDKDAETPDTIEKLDILNNRRRTLSGLDEFLAWSIIFSRKRAIRIGQEVGRINSIIGRVEKGLALAR